MGTNKTTEVVGTEKINYKKLSKYLIRSTNGDNDRLLKKLQKEHDDLKRQVGNLASFNYAREPDFVRDRNKLRDTLDEVSTIKRSIQSKYVNRILAQLERAQQKVDQEARSSEEKSERMAKDFLDGNIKHEDFLDRYINIRKNAIQRRILADKLVKERSKFDSNMAGSTNISKNKNNTTVDQQNSPTPTPRQKKRLSLTIK